MKSRKRITNTITYIVLIVISVIWLFPFVGLVLQSFRGESGGMVAYLVPKEWSWKNYQYLFGGQSKFLTWYGNTLTIALFVSVLQTLVVICVSYALSRMRFKGRKTLMNIWLVLGMFPGFLTMICLYFLLKTLGLTEAGAVPGLILISVASSGMGYYVCKGYFDTIPKALDEAAILDGATRAQILFKMIIPMSKPIIIYTALVAFMAPWCDYIFASYVAFGYESGYNVAVSMTRWVWTNDYQGFFTRFCAGGLLIAIPVTVLFMCLQKYYVEGVTGGAVKG
ncbi:MAG: sugar ABC transporter permease [Clostridia bacterium]|nr:sugar ABC transporter permease [Clostridia bacterium]MCR5073752.1 sugar ABC transporter permease [Clostridiales bacterium]